MKVEQSKLYIDTRKIIRQINSDNKNKVSETNKSNHNSSKKENKGVDIYV